MDAFQPWNSSPNKKYFVRLIEALAKEEDFDAHAPFSSLTKTQQKHLVQGSSTKVSVRYKNRYGRQRSFTAAYEGVIGYLERKLEQAETDTQKDRLLAYTREVPCPTCKGARLKPEILAVRLDSTTHGERSIAGLTELSIEDASEYLDNLVLGYREEMIAGAVLREIQARLHFLLDVGLNYLTLARSAGTLSGGEAQRIRLALSLIHI